MNWCWGFSIHPTPSWPGLVAGQSTSCVCVQDVGWPGRGPGRDREMWFLSVASKGRFSRRSARHYHARRSLRRIGLGKNKRLLVVLRPAIWKKRFELRRCVGRACCRPTIPSRTLRPASRPVNSRRHEPAHGDRARRQFFMIATPMARLSDARSRGRSPRCSRAATGSGSQANHDPALPSDPRRHRRRAKKSRDRPDSRSVTSRRVRSARFAGHLQPQSPPSLRGGGRAMEAALCFASDGGRARGRDGRPSAPMPAAWSIRDAAFCENIPVRSAFMAHVARRTTACTPHRRFAPVISYGRPRQEKS